MDSTKDVIQVNHRSAIIKVGIFWFYNHNLIAKSVDVSLLSEDSMGMYDSPFQHISEWEQNRIFLPRFKELSASEYQEQPRGRVVYSKSNNRATVFMDRTLFNDANKKALKEFFDLTDCKVTWKADPHYQTFSSLGL